jgi:hypothetical protein
VVRRAYWRELLQRYRTRILQKLNLRTTAQIMRYAVTHDLMAERSRA